MKNNPQSDIFCPICDNNSQYIVSWDYSGLNNSIFNYTALYYGCYSCGLIFISNINDDTLSNFYRDECIYHEKDHFDISSNENIEKYSCYQSIIQKFNLDGIPISDIGCGRGGFLYWLKQNNWKGRLSGTDIDLKSIPISENNGIEFLEGRAINLPYKNGSQEMLTYFHVLEHIKNIDDVLAESYRVLNDSGYIMIEVPDSEKYKDIPIGTAFWFSIREHIYHFSANSLISALNKFGFQVITIERNLLSTPEFKYPSLIILAQKKMNANNNFLEKVDIGKYLIQSKIELEQQVSNVKNFAMNSSNITFWGISQQLFSFLPLFMSYNKKIKLCDSSTTLQNSKYKNISIHRPNSITTEGVLVIAPYLHTKTIYNYAVKIGWPKDMIYCLQ